MDISFGMGKVGYKSPKLNKINIVQVLSVNCGPCLKVPPVQSFLEGLQEELDQGTFSKKEREYGRVVKGCRTGLRKGNRRRVETAGNVFGALFYINTGWPLSNARRRT